MATFTQARMQNSPCKRRQQISFFVVLLAYAGTKLWQKHAWSRVSNSRVDREPGVGGCGCGRRCGVRVGSMAINVLRCDLHFGGMARLRGVKAAILIHFILPCQRRARTSHLLNVIRQLAVGFHTSGCVGVGGGFA